METHATIAHLATILSRPLVGCAQPALLLDDVGIARKSVGPVAKRKNRPARPMDRRRTPNPSAPAGNKACPKRDRRAR